MKKYILGLITGIAILPLLDELLNVAMLWIEVLKMKPSRIISDWNKEMGEEEQTIDTYAIGFQAPNDEDYDDDDFEDD